MNKSLFTSGKDDWETPPKFFSELDSLFHFTVDVCATDGNAKCARFYGPETDGLLQNWQGETVWCNPPYSGTQDAWVRKCCLEGAKPMTTVVALLPARTDTRRFHAYIAGHARVWFVPGRLQFVGAQNSAPFPSLVAVWGGPERLPEGFWDLRRAKASGPTAVLPGV